MVVDAFDPSVLVTGIVCREFDFNTVREEELHQVIMPFSLPVGASRPLAMWILGSHKEYGQGMTKEPSQGPPSSTFLCHMSERAGT